MSLKVQIHLLPSKRIDQYFKGGMTWIKKKNGLQRFLWLLQTVRGGFVLMLGISLFVPFLESREKLLIFVGMFWLTSGVMSFVWGKYVAENPGHWWIVATAIGIVGGLFVVLRLIIDDFIEPETVLRTMGVFFLLNGLLKVADINRNPEDHPRHKMRRSPKRWSFALGVIEILLAVIMFFFWGRSEWVDVAINLLAGFWSFLGGIRMIIRGNRLRLAAKYQNSLVEKGV